MENPNGKKTLGRRKIEIKKIEKKSSLQVAFTKRRGGLFRKASELAVSCGAEVAILVQSPAEKLFAFGHPSVGALINRVAPSPGGASFGQGQIVRHRCDDDGRIKYEEAMKMLEMEKIRATEKEIRGAFWWEEPYEGLELHELEELLKALEDLEDRVAVRVEEFEKLKMYAPAPPSLQQHQASSSNLITPDNFDDDQDLIFSMYQIDQISELAPELKMYAPAPPSLQQHQASSSNLITPDNFDDDQDLIFSMYQIDQIPELAPEWRFY